MTFVGEGGCTLPLGFSVQDAVGPPLVLIVGGCTPRGQAGLHQRVYEGLDLCLGGRQLEPIYKGWNSCRCDAWDLVA